MRETVRGNKGLAERLGVSPRTVCTWRQKGWLDEAVVSEIGRVIIYDVEEALKCLNYERLLHKNLKPYKTTDQWTSK